MPKKDLWIRLKAYRFDDLVPPHLTDQVASMFGGGDASTHAFAGKLTRKLGWSTTFARRAIDEYKKFVFLGTMGDMSVTPSRVIDQVWHEHLLFSRGYREFCKKVLHRDFDHHPELLPASAQTAVFEDQYQATLDAYRREFSVEPPADIWRVPKFKPGEKTRPRKKRDDGGSGGESSPGDAPLHTWFDSGSGPSHDHPEFGGGGGFSGAGADRAWGSADTTDGHGDSGNSGGSGGDGGGSSCSSSCGGGGCGGE